MRKMKNLRVIAVIGTIFAVQSFLPLLVPTIACADEHNSQKVRLRGIDEFLAAQAKQPDEGWWWWWPPTPDYNVGWVDPDRLLFTVVDFSGLVNDWIVAEGGKSLGTRVQGIVIERTLPDGRAMVSVNLFTRNALTFVTDFSETDWPGPFVFGHEAWEVLEGAETGLATCSFSMKFINPAPGHPLPNVIDLLVFGNADEGQELISVSIHARAVGPLIADDSADRIDLGPGIATAHQVAVQAADGTLKWVVEKIKVRPIGNR